MLKHLSNCCSPAHNSNKTAGAGNSRRPASFNPSTAGATIPYPHPLSHLSLARLLFIIQQVQAEGYHVERISSFAIPGQPDADLPQQITAWAKSVHLQVGFNHKHDICVFEQL